MLDDIRRFVFLRPSKSNIDKCKKINSKCKCGPITCISGSLSQQASASDTLSKRSDATTDLTGTLLRLKQYSVVFGIATQTLSKYLNAFCESEKISATDVIVCVKGGIAFSTHLYAFVKSCRGHQDVPSTVLDALKISDLDTDVCTFVRVDEGKLGKVVAAALYDIRDQLDMLENDRHVSDTIVAAVSKAPKACPDCHAYFMNVPSVLYDPATRDWYKRRSSSMSISKNDTLKHLFGVDAQLFRLRLGTQNGLAEVIDVSIPFFYEKRHNHIVKASKQHFDDWFVKNKSKRNATYFQGSSHVVYALQMALFHSSDDIPPWNIPKFSKRLYRLIFALVIDAWMQHKMSMKAITKQLSDNVKAVHPPFDVLRKLLNDKFGQPPQSVADDLKAAITDVLAVIAARPSKTLFRKHLSVASLIDHLQNEYK